MKQRKNRIPGAVAICMAAVLSVSLPGGLLKNVWAEEALSQEKIFPESVTCMEPASLGGVSLPASPYGTLQWVNPAFVPASYSQACEVKLVSNGSYDISTLPGYREDLDAVVGQVTVYVQALAEVTEETTGEVPQEEDLQVKEGEPAEGTSEESSEDLPEQAEDGQGAEGEESSEGQADPVAGEQKEETEGDLEEDLEELLEDILFEGIYNEDEEVRRDLPPEIDDRDKSLYELTSVENDLSDSDTEEEAEDPSVEGELEERAQEDEEDAEEAPEGEEGSGEDDEELEDKPEEDLEEDPEEEDLEDEEDDSEDEDSEDEEDDSEDEADDSWEEDDDSEEEAKEIADLDLNVLEGEELDSLPNIFDSPEDFLQDPFNQNDSYEDEDYDSYASLTSSGISVSGSFLPEGVSLMVSDADTVFDIAEGADIFQAFNLSLVDVNTGEEYHVPDGEYVTVSIPVKEGYSYIVEHQLPSGGIETIIPTLSGSILVFSTHSFSPFGIAGSNTLVGPSDQGVTNTPTESPRPTKVPDVVEADEIFDEDYDIEAEETEIMVTPRTLAGSASATSNPGTTQTKAASSETNTNAYSGPVDTNSYSAANRVAPVATGDESPITAYVLLLVAAIIVFGVAKWRLSGRK